MVLAGAAAGLTLRATWQRQRQLEAEQRQALERAEEQLVASQLSLVSRVRGADLQQGELDLLRRLADGHGPAESAPADDALGRVAGGVGLAAGALARDRGQ
jgi:hypothetical protein